MKSLIYIQKKDACRSKFAEGMEAHHANIAKRHQIQARYNNKSDRYEKDPCYVDLLTQWKHIREKLWEVIGEEWRLEDEYYS